MITETQQVAIYNKTVPLIEEDLVAKGLNREQAQVFAVEIVLQYIIEAQDDPGPKMPKHSYGIKIGPGTGIINLFLTFNPSTI